MSFSTRNSIEERVKTHRIKYVPKLFLTSRSGESANAVPHYQKLCNRDFHIWEIRRGQHSRSAMAEPRPGWTAFVITVSPLPGKYELYTLVEEYSFQDKGVWLTVTTSTTDNTTSYWTGFNDVYEYSCGQGEEKSNTFCFTILYHGPTIFPSSNTVEILNTLHFWSKCWSGNTQVGDVPKCWNHIRAHSQPKDTIYFWCFVAFQTL